MWKSLNAVPCKEGVWAEKYPRIASMLGFDGNPDHIDHPVNPSYSVVKGNIIIGEKLYFGNVDLSVYTYSEIGENPLFATEADAAELIKKTLAEAGK